MARKMINGAGAAYLMEAFEHLTQLNYELRQLRWELCYNDRPSTSSTSSYLARKACRDLLHELVMFDHVMDKEDEESAKKIEIVK